MARRRKVELLIYSARKAIKKQSRIQRKERNQDKKKADIPDGVRFVGKMLMGIKTLGFTYSENNGTTLPGYIGYSDIFGQDINGSSPGFEFAAGSQRDIRERAVRGGWITADTSLNNPLTRTYTSNFSGRSSIEPFTGLKLN
jgi:cell surface protein SprA